MSTHAIYLNDLLGLSNLENVKIKFNQWNTEEDPIDVFQANPELINNQWLFWRNQKRYFTQTHKNNLASFNMKRLDAFF